jgi:hypothetical protein
MLLIDGQFSRLGRSGKLWSSCAFTYAIQSVNDDGDT